MTRRAAPDIPVEADPNAGNKGDGRIRSGRLAGLTMWQAIAVLAWPILAESFLNALVALVDTKLAASLSEEATSAIGVAAYIGWFLGLIGMAIGTGVTALVARSMGRGRVSIANAALGQGVLLAALAGVVVGVVIWFGSPVIPGLMQLKPETGALAVEYLRVIAFAVPGMTVSSCVIAALRGAGDARTPLMVMVGVNTVNVVISFLLSGVDIAYASYDHTTETVTRTVLLANPGLFDMGVVGIALGTLLAWSLGALALLAITAHGVGGVRLRARRLKPHAHTIRRIVRVGLPSFFETAGMWLGNFFVLALIGFMGDDDLYGAHVVAIRVEAFSFLPGFALGMAASTLAGQYLGAGNEKMASTAILRCVFIGAGLMGLFGVAFMLFSTTIAGAFTEQAAHFEHVPTLLLIAGTFQVPFGIGMVFRGALRGAGDTTWAMAITWTCTYLVRLPLAWLCSGIAVPLPGVGVLPNPAPLQEHMGLSNLEGLWVALGAEICIRGAAFSARFIQGGWKRVRV